MLQNRRKFTIDYRIESAAHNRLYHRLLQLKFLKATSYWVFIHYALSIIKQYIFTFIQLHIYLESVNYIDLCRRVTSKCWHLSKIFNYHYIGLCHFSALVDSLIPIQVHVHLKKNEWINKFWFHSGPRFLARLNTLILGTEEARILKYFCQHWQSKENVLVLFQPL